MYILLFLLLPGHVNKTCDNPPTTQSGLVSHWSKQVLAVKKKGGTRSVEDDDAEPRNADGEPGGMRWHCWVTVCLCLSLINTSRHRHELLSDAWWMESVSSGLPVSRDVVGRWRDRGFRPGAKSHIWIICTPAVHHGSWVRIWNVMSKMNKAENKTNLKL